MPWAAPFPQQQTSPSCARVAESPSAQITGTCSIHPSDSMSPSSQHSCQPPASTPRAQLSWGSSKPHNKYKASSQKGRAEWGASCAGNRASPAPSRAGSQPCTQPWIARTLLSDQARTQKHNESFNQRIRPWKGVQGTLRAQNPEAKAGGAAQQCSRGVPLCHPGKPTVP